MKQLLKNRSVALMITVVLVILGIFIGVIRPFGNMKEDALAHFHGSNDVIGIKDDLETKIDTAYSLASVAKRYIDEEDKLIVSLIDACEKVSESDTPREAFEANALMDECFYALSDALDGKKLSSSDENYNESLPAQYKSSDMIISHSEYNALAEEINEKMSKFPANILTKIAFVGKMELYN